jgi:hypothetical protein
MTFVYRYYDQAELERQLNARATVPDITPILTRYASESARMRARLPCRLSVSYGASEPERLDIFPAAATGPAPIFVFLQMSLPSRGVFSRYHRASLKCSGNSFISLVFATADEVIEWSHPVQR